MRHEGDDRFAAALEACRERVQRGERLDAVLVEQPVEYRDEMAALLRLGTPLRTLGRDPAPEFRARLRGVLATAPGPAQIGPGIGLVNALKSLVARPLLRVVSAVLVVAVLFGGAGVASASDDTLPDSPLYQVKTAREWVEVAVTRDPDARLNVQLRQLAQRERELDSAIRGNKPPRVVEAIGSRLEVAVGRTVDGAIQARDRGNRAPAVRAGVVLRALDHRLEQIALDTRAPVRPTLMRTRQALRMQLVRLHPD